MKKVKHIIPLLVLVILIPAGVNAQTIPGEEEMTDAIGPVGITDELAVLNNVLAYYITELESTDDTEYREIVENVVDRLQVAKAIFQIANNHTNVDEAYQNMTFEELFILLDQTYEPKDFVYSSSSNSTSGNHIADSLGSSKTVQMQYVHTSTGGIDLKKNNNHYQKQYDCEDRKTVTGAGLSTLTSYTNGDAEITGNFSYPEDFDINIREGRTTTCTDFDHSETVKRHDVMVRAIPRSGEVPAQVCTLTEDSASGTPSVRCNAFGPDRITLITTSNTYDASQSNRETQLGSTLVTLLIS